MEKEFQDAVRIRERRQRTDTTIVAADVHEEERLIKLVAEEIGRPCWGMSRHAVVAVLHSVAAAIERGEVG